MPATDAGLGPALAAVAQERRRQDAKWGTGGGTMPNPDPPDDGFDLMEALTDRKLAILAEEFGEVSMAVNEIRAGNDTLQHLREELVQVAAVAVAWVEALDEELLWITGPEYADAA